MADVVANPQSNVGSQPGAERRNGLREPRVVPIGYADVAVLSLLRRHPIGSPLAFGSDPRMSPDVHVHRCIARVVRDPKGERSGAHSTLCRIVGNDFRTIFHTLSTMGSPRVREVAPDTERRGRQGASEPPPPRRVDDSRRAECAWSATDPGTRSKPSRWAEASSAGSPRVGRSEQNRRAEKGRDHGSHRDRHRGR